MPTPQVLLGAEARAQLKNGLDLLAQVISLTLGPRAGGVALSRFAKGPEVLTSSAVIARRIVEIPCRGANVGAMLLRNALCRVNDQLGDGGATTAALAHALLAGGYRQLAAGANPMLLRRGMECGLRAAVAALQAQARPLGGERDLAGLAHAATGDAELSQRLGEIFNRLGAEGSVVIEEYAATYLAHQFFEGAIWAGGFVSPAFVTDQARQQTPLAEPHILVTDYTITEQAQIVRRVLGRVVARAGVAGGDGLLQRRPRLEDAELLLRPDLVRVDAGPLQPLAILLDAEAALREAVGVLSPERPLLDEAPVEHDEHDGRAEAHDPGPRAFPEDAVDDPVADGASHEADGDREPERHGIGTRKREARESAGDKGDEQRPDHGSEHSRSVARTSARA